MKTRWLALAAAALLAACVSITLQKPGTVRVGALQVTAQDSWNVLPAAMTPFARKGAQVWTRDGVLLDRLMIIPSVPEGEPLFSEPDKAIALPRFKADMLPDEIAQFTESSLVKLLGEGGTVVKTANLRPARFGEQRGVMFDLRATLTEGPAYRGTAGAFIASGQLNMVLFIGADPHYYDRSRPAAEAVITSARL